MKIHDIVVEDFDLDFVEESGNIEYVKNIITLVGIDTDIFLVGSCLGKDMVNIDCLGEELNFIWHGTTEDFSLKSEVWETGVNGSDCLAFLKDFLIFAESLNKSEKFHEKKRMRLAEKYNLK